MLRIPEAIDLTIYSIKRYRCYDSYRYKAVIHTVHGYTNKLFLVKHRGTCFHHKDKDVLMMSVRTWEPEALYAKNTIKHGVYTLDSLKKLVPEIENKLISKQEV